MSDQPAASVEMRDWPGLVTQADRQDQQPGSGRIQVNLQSDKQGEMTVRRGLRPVLFDSE